MRKIIFVGRSEAGKTSLTQAMRGETVTYHKTQYVNCYDVIIDTPGEYAETARVAHALATYSYEADIVGLLISAIEPYSLYPPCITVLANREVVGIVTKIDHRLANPHRAAEWLKLAGCRKIFYISSYTGEGIPELLEYLKEEGDVLPWEKAKEMQDAFNRRGGSYSDVDESLKMDDNLDKQRRFKPVVVGEDVLGREITGDGQSVVPSKDVPAMAHVKFKTQLDEEEIVNERELRRMEQEQKAAEEKTAEKKKD